MTCPCKVCSNYKCRFRHLIRCQRCKGCARENQRAENKRRLENGMYDNCSVINFRPKHLRVKGEVVHEDIKRTRMGRTGKKG